MLWHPPSREGVGLAPRRGAQDEKVGAFGKVIRHIPLHQAPGPLADESTALVSGALHPALALHRHFVAEEAPLGGTLHSLQVRKERGLLLGELPQGVQGLGQVEGAAPRQLGGVPRSSGPRGRKRLPKRDSTAWPCAETVLRHGWW